MTPRKGSSTPRTAGLSLVLAGLLTGCPWRPPDPPDPVPEEDAGTSLIGRDPACTLTGSLAVTLGEGEWGNFTPLAPGQDPELHYGPQGGMHFLLGAEVGNPAQEFPGLQLDFVAERQRCSADGSCLPFETMGRYQALVRDTADMQPREGGGVAVSGFLVIVSDWRVGERRRIRVDVQDRCGRTGSAVQELGPVP